MKKLIVFMILSMVAMGEIHPTLSLKGTGIGEESLPEWNITKLSFEEDKYYVNVNLENDNGDKYRLDSLTKGTEVLSVFYDDISGDGLKEVFLITRLDGKYGVAAYQEEYRPGYEFPEIGRVYPLSGYLTGKFEDEKGLNASKVRSVTRGLKPANYSSVGFWTHWEEGNFYEDIDYFDGEFVGYYTFEGDRVEKVEDSYGYVVDFGNNIYGKFSGSKFDGFTLNEIYEGRVEGDKVIKDGRYEFRAERVYRSGQYVDGLEEGRWLEAYSGYEVYYYYEDGVEVRSEVVDNE